MILMETNTTHLTRIEREAKEYAEGPHYSDGSSLSCSPQLYLKKGYLKGYAVATDRANTRAAPVVKALEEAIAYIECDTGCLSLGKLKHILETYKNDNV